MIEKYKNLVYSIASMYKGLAPLEDLVQEGFIGLFKAYKRYDSSKNTKFSTFAYPYILGEINSFLKENRPIKISKEVISLSSKIEKARSFLAQEYGRFPTDIEISDYLNVNLYDYNLAVNSNNPLLSLDYSYDSEISLYDALGNYYDIDRLLMVKDALSRMDSIDKEIFLKYYLYDLSQNEIAEEVGLNQVSVSRRYQKVLRKLKNVV